MAAVKIVRTRLSRYEVPLRRTFVSSHVVTAARSGLIVEVWDEADRRGLGEIAPLPGFSLESLDEAETAARDFCASCDEDLAAVPPSVRFGVSTALSDVASRAAGLPLSKWLAPDAPLAVPCNAVLPIGATAAEVRAACRPGIDIVKVKVGQAGEIGALLNLLPTGVRLRLDANGAWNPEEAIAALRGLPPERIDYVEEPLAAEHTDALGEVHAACGLGFALDETVRDRQRWHELLECDAVTAVVLKPTLIGDLDECAELAAAARALDREVTVTTTMESGVGVTACLHVAAAIATGPCGLDTLGFFEETLLRRRLEFDAGRLLVPDAPGLGVDVDRTRLEICGEWHV